MNRLVAILVLILTIVAVVDVATLAMVGVVPLWASFATSGAALLVTVVAARTMLARQ